MEHTEIVAALREIKTELDTGLDGETDRQYLAEATSDQLLLLIEELSK